MNLLDYKGSFLVQFQPVRKAGRNKEGKSQYFEVCTQMEMELSHSVKEAAQRRQLQTRLAQKGLKQASYLEKVVPLRPLILHPSHCLTILLPRVSGAKKKERHFASQDQKASDKK